MIRMTVSEIRSDLSDVLSLVAFKGERVIIQRNGRDVAAIVSMVDMLTLEEADAPAAEAPSAASSDADAPLTDAEVEEVERVIGLR